MAKIIVRRDQQEEVRRLHPKPAYSRVINLEVLVGDGLGGYGFNFTPPLGNRLWLLSVDLWFFNYTLDIAIGGFIYVRTGKGKPVNHQEVWNNWEYVVDDTSGIKPCIYWVGLRGHIRWDMMKFYEGTGRRFAVVISNLNVDQNWLCNAAFQISEG